jgi:hypothetical protein
MALAGENVNEVHEHKILVDPAIARSRAAKGALNLLRHHLLDLGSSFSGGNGSDAKHK